MRGARFARNLWLTASARFSTIKTEGQVKDRGVMNLFSFREPMNAWTHGMWMLMCIPAGLLLQCRAGRCPLKHVGFAIFSLSLVCCFWGSWLYHAAGTTEYVEWCARLDYIGIFLLIAGTTTPVALVVMRGWYRVGLLISIWTMAAIGILLRGLSVPLPDGLSTALYILMGWSGVVCFVDLARWLSSRQLRPLWIGGVLYSVGAIINSFQWPIIWPGVFGAHELFHVFVMVASYFHFMFMLRVVAPFDGTRRVPSPDAIPLRATA
jgi:hemolysin III